MKSPLAARMSEAGAASQPLQARLGEARELAHMARRRSMLSTDRSYEQEDELTRQGQTS